MAIFIIGIILIFAISIVLGCKIASEDNSKESPVVVRLNPEKMDAARILRQLNESYDMVKSTTNPGVFFGRLCFCFDCALALTKYSDDIFSGATPKQELERLSSNLEELVNDFIDRSYNAEYEKAMQLKTEKGRQNRMIKYFDTLESTFENAHSFWTGNSNSPHYTGPLYTENNLTKVKELKIKTI